MSVEFTVKVDDRQLIKDLEKLGPKCKPVLKKAMRPLAREALKAIKPLIPKRTGVLRKSITLVPIKSQRFYTVGFRIFFRYVDHETDKKTGKRKAKFSKSSSKTSKFYTFAPEYGVKKGTRNQKAQEFVKKGAAIAESYVPRCKQAIAEGIAEVWDKR